MLKSWFKFLCITYKMNSVYIDSAVASSPIYIGPTNASSVIIGNANCSTIVNGPLVMGSSTIVNGPLVMGTGKNITLQPATGLVVPITGQLGYRYTVVNGTGPYTMTGVGTPQEVTNFSVPPGVWLYEAQVIVGSTFAVSYFEWYISSASATVDLTRVCGGCITVQGIWSRNTGIISNTATTTWYLNAKAAVANVQYTNINICLTRIA